MIPPSPDLQRRFRNTEGLVKSGRSYLVAEFVTKYPNDYLDIATYESMLKVIQY